MKGLVFAIEEFSIYDGPGIRTTVFLKGCPMRCKWCHNPEGQAAHPEEVRKPDGTVRISGQEWEDTALVERLLKNERILKNGGGVTFSGGEPLMQAGFLSSCLNKLKGRLHTAIETAGNVPEEAFNETIRKADLVLFDLKLMAEKESMRFTACGNARILRNFRTLTGSGIPFLVRTPLIPGVTDTEDNLKRIAVFLREHGVSEIELLPYNSLAGAKYASLGRNYDPGFCENETPKPRTELFEQFGIRAKVL